MKRAAGHVDRHDSIFASCRCCCSRLVCVCFESSAVPTDVLIPPYGGEGVPLWPPPIQRAAACVRTPWTASLARCERASGRTDVCLRTCLRENEPMYGGREGRRSGPRAGVLNQQQARLRGPPLRGCHQLSRVREPRGLTNAEGTGASGPRSFKNTHTARCTE